MRQGCSLFTQIFNIVLEALSGVMREEEEIKGPQIGKEIFEDDIILYLRY